MSETIQFTGTREEFMAKARDKRVSDNRLVEIMTNADNFYRPEIVSMAEELHTLRWQYAELADSIEKTATELSEVLQILRAKK